MDYFIYIPFGLALAYAVLGGVALGMPMAGLLHDKQSQHPERYLVKSWELAHLLLLAVLGSLLALYPLVFDAAVPLLGPLWVVTAVAVAVKLLFKLVVFFGGRERLTYRGALAAASLVVAALLMQNVTVLLTGNANPMSHPGLALVLGLVGVLMTVALWAGWFYRPGSVVRQGARVSYWAAGLASLTLLPFVVLTDPVVIGERSLWEVSWPLAPAAVLSVAWLMMGWRRRYFAAAATLATGIGFTLLFLLLPYAVRPWLLLEEATTSPIAQADSAAGMGLVLVIAVPVLVILYRMVASARSSSA